MKSTIKFRAWDKTYNCWYEPTHRAYEGKLWELMVGFSGDLSAYSMRIGKTELVHESMFPDRYELMQYTGLEDKNGREDYASDIVSVNIGGVFYNREIYQHASGAWAIDLPTQSTTNDMPIFLYSIDHEVIGNIYENPELLNQ